jgi:hypothetical protein
MKLFPVVAGVLATSAVSVVCLSAYTDSTEATPLRLAIHYLDGLSARSRDTPQDLRFLHYGCHLSLLLTNTSKDEIHLWKPNCPEGDDAIRLEFKLDADSQEIGTAQTSHVYTGGMGIPKTMKLVPGDSLVYRIDFSSFWSLPFVLKPGAQADLLDSSQASSDYSGPDPDCEQSVAWTHRNPVGTCARRQSHGL